MIHYMIIKAATLIASLHLGIFPIVSTDIIKGEIQYKIPLTNTVKTIELPEEDRYNCELAYGDYLILIDNEYAGIVKE